MSIIRLHKKDNPFVQIDKTGLNDSTLSFKAKGILCYLLSKPDGWKPKVEEIARNNADGESAIRSGLKELRQHKYCTLEILRNPKGHIIDKIFHIYEIPFHEQELSTQKPTQEPIEPYGENPQMDNPQMEKLKMDNPHVEKPNVDNPSVENHHYSNNNYSNNDSNNNESVCDENEKNQKNQHTHPLEDFSKKSEKPQSNPENKSLKTARGKKAKNTRPPRSGRSPQSITFAQSPYLDPEAFAELLTEIGYPKADPEHYYHKISLYAQSEGLLKSDWKAYVQLWLQDDAKKNKLQFRKVSPSTKAHPDLEIQAEFSRLQSDLAEGVFTEAAHLEGVLERLRQLWREASDPLREKIEAFSSQVQNQLQSFNEDIPPHHKPKPKPEKASQSQSQTSAGRSIRQAFRERLQAIQPPDDTS